MTGKVMTKASGTSAPDFAAAPAGSESLCSAGDVDCLRAGAIPSARAQMRVTLIIDGFLERGR
jgi:hypothetical protein